MRQLFQLPSLISPQSVFTIPAGMPRPGYMLRVRVAGIDAPWAWSAGNQVTLRAAAPAGKMVEYLEHVPDVSSEIRWAGSLDFPAVSGGGLSQSLTVTVPGAEVGDIVQLGLDSAPPAGLHFQAWVSAADTVTVRATNVQSGAIDPAAQTFRIKVCKG